MITLAKGIIASVLLVAAAHAASPDLQTILPRGGQIGTDVELTFTGNRLDDAEEVILYDHGLQVKSLEVIDAKKVTARLAIGDDCPLGEQRMRLRCRGGISELRTFWVGQYPTVHEAEPNNAFTQPQKIERNITIEGVAENEDIDHYAVELAKGERIALEVEAIRLGGAMFDPYIAILNSKRFEVAKADDTPLLVQDAHTEYVASDSGTYIIQVRDSSYVGGNNFRYRLHVGDFPRPIGIWPPGGRPGETVAATFLSAGPSVGATSKPVRLPNLPGNDKSLFHPVFFEYADGTQSPSPNLLRVADMPHFEETEPNNSRRSPNSAGEPGTVSLPIAFHGAISEEGDEDWFQFYGKKGQKVVLRVFARELGSPLDSLLHLYKPDGKYLAGNDDFQNQPDSKITQQLPEDGTYSFRVRDHLRNGGHSYVYRIEITQAEPDLVVSIPRFERRNSQARQTIQVPVGNRYASLIAVERSEFSGDVAIEAPSLPSGVSLYADTMRASINQFPIVFEASSDATVNGGVFPLLARHVDAGKGITGSFAQTVELVLGQPNNTPYYLAAAPRRLPIAVVDPVPFKVEVETPQVPLVQNGTIDLNVSITREEGFEKPVTLRMLWNPPGIGSPRTIRIAKGKTEAVYRLNANGSAQQATWQVAILGESDAGKGPVFASSTLVPLTVDPPFVTGKISLAATKQGQPARVVCKIEHQRTFAGSAEVSLVGLPAKCSADPLPLTADTTELVFTVNTADDAPIGKHKNLFCRVAIPATGEAAIPHSIAAGGVLRIDKPTSHPSGTPQVANSPAASTPAKSKPLSRLEELRLAAKAAREARAGNASAND